MSTAKQQETHYNQSVSSTSTVPALWWKYTLLHMWFFFPFRPACYFFVRPKV